MSRMKALKSNSTIPSRQVWTRLGVAMTVPGPVADIIDDLLGVCRGAVTANTHLIIDNAYDDDDDGCNVTPPWLIALEETLTASQPPDSEGAQENGKAVVHRKKLCSRAAAQKCAETLALGFARQILHELYGDNHD